MPFNDLNTEIWLTVDQARLLYAAAQWLRKYDAWESETVSAGGKIGVYPCDTSLSQAARFIAENVDKMDKKEPRIVLSDGAMSVLNDVSKHLDHYVIMLAGKDEKKGRWKRK